MTEKELQPKPKKRPRPKGTSPARPGLCPGGGYFRDPETLVLVADMPGVSVIK